MGDFLDIDDVRSFVREWNFKYPIDRWWRAKYNIPFGSPQHLDHPLLDMRIAFEEDCLHKRMEQELEQEENIKDLYQPGRGDWLNKQPKFTKMTGVDVDDAFSRLASDMDRLKDIAVRSTESGKQTIRI